jgi:hypothetical protein
VHKVAFWFTVPTMIWLVGLDPNMFCPVFPPFHPLRSQGSYNGDFQGPSFCLISPSKEVTPTAIREKGRRLAELERGCWKGLVIAKLKWVWGNCMSFHSFLILVTRPPFFFSLIKICIHHRSYKHVMLQQKCTEEQESFAKSILCWCFT